MSEQEIGKMVNLAMYDISVYVGENIRENTKAAFRKAISLIDSGHFKRAFVANTTTRQRWALAAGREIDANRIGDSYRMPVICEGVAAGDLCNRIGEIAETLRSLEIDLLIINSWEFASENTRYKDSLLFKLRGILEDLGITIVIYSHQTNAGSWDMGKMTRHLGKLSAIAGHIGTVEHDEEMQEEEMNAVARPKEVSERFVGEEGLVGHREEAAEDEYPEPYEEVYEEEGELVPA
jgi:hypothetical protein